MEDSDWISDPANRETYQCV